MAKYVCDYDKVESIANNIITITDDMVLVINNSVNKINSLLSTWKGDASVSVNSLLNTQIEGVNSNIQEIVEMANFIKSAKDNIASSETILASMKI